MSELTTDDVIRRFNESFVQRDLDALSGLVAQDCVMESVGPAPDGTRYEGVTRACGSGKNWRTTRTRASSPRRSSSPQTGRPSAGGRGSATTPTWCSATRR